MKSIFKTMLGFLVVAVSACATLPQHQAVATSQTLNQTGSAYSAEENSQENLMDKLEKADLALREARLTDAEILYRQLTKSHPRLRDVWLRLGNVYTRLAQLEAAERTYRLGLRYRPQDGRLWNNLALVQMKQAVKTLEASSQVLAPEDPYMPRIRRFHDALLHTGTDVASGTDSPDTGVNEGSPQATNGPDTPPAVVKPKQLADSQGVLADTAAASGSEIDPDANVSKINSSRQYPTVSNTAD